MSFIAGSHQFDVLIREVKPEANSIYPTIYFEFNFIHKSPEPFLIVDPIFQFFVFDGRYHYLGPLIFGEPYYHLHDNRTFLVTARLILDHYAIKRIEELRKNEDLMFKINGVVTIIPAKGRTVARSTIEDRIPKSDWVERFLPAFKYKEVFLVEIPKLEYPDFEKVINHLNDAWKHYSMGYYNVVLTSCRKTIEEVGKIIKELGFKTKEEEKTIPDWKKFFNSKDIGDIVGTINQKIYGFTSPGAHAGRSINKKDAEYALLIVHAMVNLVINKIRFRDR